MPEEKILLRTPADEFKGVRTFSQQIKHLGANNYRMAANINGQMPTPEKESETGPESVTSKAQIMECRDGRRYPGSH